MNNKRMSAKGTILALGFLLLLRAPSLFSEGSCGDDKACQLVVNLTSIQPRLSPLPGETMSEIDQVRKIVDEQGMDKAAEWIVNNFKEFQLVRLKNFAETWTEKDGKPGAKLNDTILTIIQAIVTEIDYRRILWDDIIAIGEGTPHPSNSSKMITPDGAEIFSRNIRDNRHYEDLEREENYHLPGHVRLQPQSMVNIPFLDAGISGILSTNGFASVAYSAGTNRRSVPMLLREATCLSLEDVRDATGSEKYILRDVAVHDPDGSVTTFKTVCKSCHSFMDQIAPAFIYHDYNLSILYGILTPEKTRERVVPVPPNNKMLKVVNQNGYIPKDDAWRSEFSDGQINLLGWPKDQRSGFGVQSLAKAISNSEGFAKCQPKKAFETVCGRPVKDSDQAFIASLVKDFKENSYNLKRAFIKSAIYCAEGGQ